MVGTVLQKTRRLDALGWVSLGAVFISAACLLWAGPRWAGLVAGLGLLTAAVSWSWDRWSGRDVVSSVMMAILIGLHVGCGATAFVLHQMFDSSLSDAALQIPKLGKTVRDPNDLFSVGFPEGWHVEPLAGPDQSGLRFRPDEPNSYMGVSEAVVMVRPLKTAPSSVKDFLQKTADAVSHRNPDPSTKRIFSFRTEPAKLLGGAPGIWIELELHRFWVSIRQVTLFTIKNKRYVCSVSASGLKAHSTLARVLCLGLLETLRIEPAPAPAKKNP